MSLETSYLNIVKIWRTRNKYGKVATSSLTNEVLGHIQGYCYLSPLLPKTVYNQFWNTSRTQSQSESIQEEFNAKLLLTSGSRWSRENRLTKKGIKSIPGKALYKSLTYIVPKIWAEVTAVKSDTQEIYFPVTPQGTSTLQQWGYWQFHLPFLENYLNPAFFKGSLHSFDMCESSCCRYKLEGFVQVSGRCIKGKTQ